MYSKKTTNSDVVITTQEDQVLLARVRSGHHLMFAETCNRYNSEESASYARCGDAKEDMKHWFMECPGTLEARQRTFGTTLMELPMLTEFPEKTLELAQKCGSAQW